MIKINISENEENQRLDRFLRKYYKKAPLSYIYKLIRKDVKINGKRGKEDTLLRAGDEMIIYISSEESDGYREEKIVHKGRRQFKVAYEDENILIVEKPFGLLTHGDASEKKYHLANQVCGYLAEKGEYEPGTEKTFAPAPVNRLDRNTTGLVIFGKNNSSLQNLNQMIREKGYVSKYYLTVVAGQLKKELVLKDKMEKNRETNTVSVISMDEEGGKVMETIARPLNYKNGYTLVEVELITGRTHQIRAHLSKAGYPIIGDAKYGSRSINQKVDKKFGLTTQFLHAYRLKFFDGLGNLKYLAGKEVIGQLPENLARIKQDIFD